MTDGRYASLFEFGPIGMGEADLDGRLVSVNGALLAMLGRRPGELLGAHVSTLVHPQDLGTQSEDIRSVVAGELASYRSRRVFAHADGSGVEVVVFTTGVVDSGGEIVGIVSVIVDVTSEEKLQHQLTAELLLSSGRQEFVDALLDSLDVGIIACDAQGRLTQFNATTRGWHGIDFRDDVDPEHFAERFSLFEADGCTPVSLENMPLLRALKEGRVANAEVVIAPHDRPTTRVMVNGRALYGADGALCGAVVAMHDISEQRRLQDDLRFQALHDDLTGLPNRRLLADRLEVALAQRVVRAGQGVALLMLDIDHFKVVNDTYGDDHGDLLLIEVAQVLRSCCREGDTVARLGSDEFAIVLPDAGVLEALRVSERITAALGGPLRVGGRSIHTSVSVGIVVADGQDRSDLMRQVDIAMNSAKDQLASPVVFDAALHGEVLARFKLELELRGVVERGELILEYQPILDLRAHALVEVEALLRWEHPVHGRIPPMSFIPLAESSGSICRIGDWVLETACRQLLTWDIEHPGSELGMAVNLSPRQLLDENLVIRVCEILVRVGVAPERIVLEITETALGGDIEEMILKLHGLKSLGVRLAIDDFGTGFSSLSYLRRLPVDILKVDKSFVAGIAKQPEEWALTAAIIKLAKSLGKQTLAEGIELGEQLAHLRALNCDRGQGYLFDRPLSPAAVGERLAGRSVRTR